MNTSTDPLLSEAAYFILLSLAPEPKHGYAIMKAVRELSEHRVLLSTGALYGSLKRLLDQGWIIRKEEPGIKGADRKRKVYQLSEHGRKALRGEIARLQQPLMLAERRVGEEGS